MSNSILRTISIITKLLAVALVFLLPLYPFIVVYTILGLLANIIDLNTQYATKLVYIRYPYLKYIQFISLPLVGYGLHSFISLF